MRVNCSAVAALFLAAISSSPAPAQELIFAVNEGVTYRIVPAETRERYREFGELLAKALKRPVKVVPVDDYPTLRTNLEAKAYDLAYVHPAHHSYRAVRDQGYRLVALTKGYTEYKARFLMGKDAPYKQPEDIRGKAMVMPDADSITAWMVRATLRDLGMDPAKEHLGTTRYQDGIPFMMENGFYEIGITAAGAVVKDWQSKGGKVLFESKPVPIKHVIVSPKVSQTDADRIRNFVLGLEKSKDGQAILEKIGFKGFVAPDSQQTIELTKWLGI